MSKKYIIVLIIVLIIVAISYYLYFENTTLKVTKFNIANSKIPSEFKNYKIIQISDFHNSNFKKLTNSIINKIKEEKPNIIVITGDFVDSRKTNIDISINLIKDIKDIAPIYYVVGNHESRIQNYDELIQKLKMEGVNILNNEVKQLELDNARINLIGIKDPSMFHQDVSKNSSIINKEINDLQYDKKIFTILLSHRPETFETYVNNNLDLVFTGHAHGGQVRLPFIGALYAPHQGAFPKYTSGVYEKENTKMIVNRGIGNSLFPFRINNRPEIVVVTLYNR